jgi:glycosyltransferase involved in cell wall biosynthesis
MSPQKITFTVFTATYNRARLLPVLFKSLCEQTRSDFEWVIVDDGSDDDTAAVVNGFRHQANFPVIYAVQEHGGKHRAINFGLRLARGYFFGIADSDDFLTPTAIETCAKHYSDIPDSRKDQFVGITGLCATSTGELIGTEFPSDVFDSDALALSAHRVQGDKAGFLRTDILREFPFPENLGSFVPESLIWNRIARRYSTRYFNQVIMMCDYQPDGLSARSLRIRMNSPVASRQYYYEFISMGRQMPMDIMLRYYSNYVRFSFHAGVSLSQQVSASPSKAICAASAPVGWAAYVVDKFRAKREAA